MAKDESVGIIGLGIMGSAIATNLARAGWKVVGYDIDASRIEKVAAKIEFAGSAAEVAAAASYVLTSLPHPAALAATAREIAASRLPSRIVAELSTLAIEHKAAAEAMLRAAGHVMIDAPISGTGAQAQTKDIVIYASGDPGAIRSLALVFAGFARQTHDLGAFGNGSRMKYVANLLVAIHNVAAAEAMVLGMKAGLDPAQVYKLATDGAGNSRVLELRGPMMVNGRYEDATMKLSVWQKDLAIIRSFAEGVGAPTPLLDATMPLYEAALAAGHGSHDTAAVCAVLEEMGGIKR